MLYSKSRASLEFELPIKRLSVFDGKKKKIYFIIVRDSVSFFCLWDKSWKNEIGGTNIILIFKDLNL